MNIFSNVFSIFIIGSFLVGCGANNGPIPDQKILHLDEGKKFIHDIDSAHDKSKILFIYNPNNGMVNVRTLTYYELNNNNRIGKLKANTYIKFNLFDGDNRIAGKNEEVMSYLNIPDLLVKAADNITAEHNVVTNSNNIYCLKQNNNMGILLSTGISMKFVDNDTCLNDIKLMILEKEQHRLMENDQTLKDLN